MTCTRNLARAASGLRAAPPSEMRLPAITLTPLLDEDSIDEFRRESPPPLSADPEPICRPMCSSRPRMPSSGLWVARTGNAATTKLSHLSTSPRFVRSTHDVSKAARSGSTGLKEGRREC